MQKKSIYILYVLLACRFGNLLSNDQSNTCTAVSDRYTQSLASLIFYSKTTLKELSPFQRPSIGDSDKIHFSNADVEKLWGKISQEIHKTDSTLDLFFRLSHFEEAYCSYENFQQSNVSTIENGARQSLISAIRSLEILWHNALEKEGIETPKDAPSLNDPSLITRKMPLDANFENNHYLTSSMKRKMKPYLLPFDHSMYSILDSLFLKKRVTKNKETFAKSGFRIIATGPRSFVQVAEHPKLPGYLVKAYFDTELRKKREKESWEWFVLRCEGATKVRTIIQIKKIRHFTVADKWIYCLPPEPSPPLDKNHTRHYALLLTKNMKLTPEKLNYHAWSHYITKDHLNELYTIISRAKGSSYRPDNIAYTENGNFAFIDTEYPSKGPDFTSIRKHLNSKMRTYWDKLVIKGGR